MNTAIALATLSGLSAAALGQTGSVILTTSTDTVLAGESFTVTATATGTIGIFAYNLLVDAAEGAGLIESTSDLFDNPTGSSLIFGAPSGSGLGAGTGFGVDRRDASTGLLLTPAPIDGIPFFTFTVTTRADAVGTIVYAAGTGSGTKAALSYPDTSFPPIIVAADYPNIEFGGVSVSIVPAPAAFAVLGMTVFVSRRRR